MKIYVASSWRNLRQPEVVVALASLGHEVYDFRHPAPGNDGFSWKAVATEEQLRDPRAYRDEVLTHPVSVQGFGYDMEAMNQCEVCVLVLPCGRSAHLELGYAVGVGKLTIVLLDDPLSEPELMYKMCHRLVTSLAELCTVLKHPRGRALGA